jgi:hypothetical protein
VSPLSTHTVSIHHVIWGDVGREGEDYGRSLFHSQLGFF